MPFYMMYDKSHLIMENDGTERITGNNMSYNSCFVTQNNSVVL